MLRNALMLIVAVLVAGGCGTRFDNPTAPSPSRLVPDAGATADAIPSSAGVPVCHRTARRPDAFIQIAIPAQALPAHLDHGDARIGYPVPGQPGTKFSAACALVPVSPLTIKFDGLAVHAAPMTTYVESGLTVSAIAGGWQAWLPAPNPPAPYILFWSSTGGPTTGAVRIGAADGAPFRFTSVELYSSITPIPYVFTGTLDSMPVFSVTATHPLTYGNFVPISNPQATDLINELTITMTNPDVGSCCGPNPMGIDNIAVVF